MFDKNTKEEFIIFGEEIKVKDFRREINTEFLGVDLMESRRKRCTRQLQILSKSTLKQVFMNANNKEHLEKK
jgi:hypothetical protein